jgi:hypothetical protein
MQAHCYNLMTKLSLFCNMLNSSGPTGDIT